MKNAFDKKLFSRRDVNANQLVIEAKTQTRMM